MTTKCFMNIKEKKFQFRKQKIRSNSFILNESEGSIKEAVSTVKKGSKEGDLVNKIN